MTSKRSTGWATLRSEVLHLQVDPSSVKQLKFFIAASANQSLEYIELVTPSQLVSISCSTLYKNSELDLTSASTGYNYKQLGAITSRALIATQEQM